MEPEIIETISYAWSCPLCKYSPPDTKGTREAAQAAFKAHENTTYHQSMRSSRKNL